MKNLKKNFFVKTTYSYVNLFYLYFPIVIFFLLVPILFNFPSNDQNAKTALFNVDLFNLFGKEKFITEIGLSSIALWIFMLLANISIAVGIYYGLKRLNKFMKNVFEDKPFIEENGKHLKTIGIIIILVSTLVFLCKTTSAYIVPMQLSVAIKYLYFIAILISSLFNPYLVVGLVIFVIGEVIVRAVKMKDEQDLTV